VNTAPKPTGGARPSRVLLHDSEQIVPARMIHKTEGRHPPPPDLKLLALYSLKKTHFSIAPSHGMC
jgi:hypothetical protein